MKASKSTAASSLSVFVNHPRSASFLRKKIAKYLVSRQPALSFDNLVTLLNRRSEVVMEICAALFGDNVPFYTVTVE